MDKKKFASAYNFARFIIVKKADELSEEFERFDEMLEGSILTDEMYENITKNRELLTEKLNDCFKKNLGKIGEQIIKEWKK